MTPANPPSLPRKFFYSVYRLFQSFATDGFRTTFEKIKYRVLRGKLMVREKYTECGYADPDLAYAAWRKKNVPDAAALEAMRSRSQSFSYKPVFSVILPAYNGDPVFLEKAVQSLRAQAWPHWQLCVSDDGSTLPEGKEILKRHAAQDPRIVCVFQEKNGGIIANSQKAARLATGEFVAFMDQDDLLAPDAFYRAAEELNRDPSWDCLYSDNDKVDLNDVHREAYFKPDYSPDEFFCHNYIGHLTILRRSLFEKIGGFIPGYEGAQDFELLLRVVEQTEKIAHLPYILYSWRRSPGSTASSPTAKQYAYDSGRKALKHFFSRRGVELQVEESGERGLYRCRFPFRSPQKVSAVILAEKGADAANLAANLQSRTRCDFFEIIVSVPADSGKKPALERLGCRVVEAAPGSGWSARANQARRAASGDVLLFLSGEVRVRNGEWMHSLLEPLQRDSVGVVGAKILDSQDCIRHGGIVVGLKGVMDDALKGVPDDAVIYENPHHLIRNASAVSALCLLTRASLFDELSGFDENLSRPLAEADLGFKARQKGRWIVWTPFAVLTLAENAKSEEPSPPEWEIFKKKWEKVLSAPDPFYNVNLTRKYYDFSPNLE